MTIYDDMQSVASGLLVEFNQGSVKLVRIQTGVGPAYDPGTSEETTIPLTGATVKGVSFKYVQSGQAVASDLTVTMPADIVPTMTDFIEIDGKRFKVISIQPIPPAGTIVVYQVNVRKL